VLRPPTSTVETLLEDACAHLIKVDPKLKTLIEKHHCEWSFCYTLRVGLCWWALWCMIS
jgi:hypothetical protein